jgi:serine protease
MRNWQSLVGSAGLVLLMAACGGAPNANVETDTGRIETVTQGSSANLPRFVEGEVIVKFRDGSASLTSLSLSGFKLQSTRELGGGEQLMSVTDELGLNRLTTQGARSTLDVVEALKARGDVEFAQPNYLYYPAATPNDTYYNLQWHYPKINLPSAWDLTTGSSSVLVAVLDTGKTAHPDLNSQFVGGYDFVSSSSNARDGNGRDSDATDPGDSQQSYHGTHVAGTIAARTNNGSGVAGVCWNCRVVPVRVLGYSGGSTADIADGIRWASGASVTGVPANPNPAKVINMSLGGDLGAGNTCATADAVTQNAINTAVSRGTTVVVAAGNSNADTSRFTPASCNNTVTVAATDTRNYRAPYSNYGPAVDVAAPGGDTSIDRNGDGYVDGVLSTLRNSSGYIYSFYQGTSMATPHVAGVVGLMLSRSPSLTPSNVLTRLKNSATPLSSTACSGGCGSGLIDARKAIQ